MLQLAFYNGEEKYNKNQFFIRLTKNIENRVQDITVFSYDIVSDTNISSRSKGNTYKYIWYSFQYFVVPCTGWYNNMIYLTKLTSEVPEVSRFTYCSDWIGDFFTLDLFVSGNRHKLTVFP